MNEVIEKYYQAEIEYSSDKLLNREIESKWKALSNLAESTSGNSTQPDILPQSVISGRNLQRLAFMPVFVLHFVS